MANEIEGRKGIQFSFEYGSFLDDEGQDLFDSTFSPSLNDDTSNSLFSSADY
jgi:hypothetical protein